MASASCDNDGQKRARYREEAAWNDGRCLLGKGKQPREKRQFGVNERRE